MKKLIFVLFSLLLLAGCSGDSYQTISSEKALEMIEGSNVNVIDVRSPEEFEAGHIPNATLIPLEKLEEMQSELDKSEKYILVCRSGNRSATASSLLKEKGFKEIYNLSGGMNGWTGEVIK
jgi:rhodanese-related sulfurtransferase